MFSKSQNILSVFVAVFYAFAGYSSLLAVSEDNSQANPQLPDLDQSARLMDYLQFAKANNPGIKSAYDQWQAALEKIPQAKSLADPKLSYTYFLEEVETRVGPQEQKISIMQTFPWFGKTDLRANIETSNASAQWHQYQHVMHGLFYEVRSAYFDFYYLGRAIEITRENLQILNSLEEVTQSQFKSGKTDYASVIQFQFEILKLEDSLQSLVASKSPMLARLNAALNRPLDADLTFPTILPDLKLYYSQNQLIDILEKTNHRLAALGDISKSQQAKLELVNKNQYPDIGVGIGYISTDEAVMPVSDSGQDPVTVTLSINLPIWHDKNSAQKREARLQKNAIHYQIANEKNLIHAQLRSAIFQWQDAQRKRELYQGGLIPKVKKTFKVVQQDYTSGRSDFLTLVDIIRSLQDLELSYEKALTQQGKALAHIEVLVGGHLIESVKNKEVIN